MPVHLLHDHDPWLVVVAGLLCYAACFAALDILGRARTEDGGVPFKRLVVAAITFGFGIWSAHFIAVLAFKPPMTTGYDVTGTLLSIAIGIVGSIPGLALLVRRPAGWTGWVSAGLVLGITITALHFVGMWAVRLQGRLDYDASLVVVAFVVGVALCVAAARVTVGRDGLRRRPIGALLLAAAIYGMHMTAMAAVSIVPDPSIAAPSTMPPALLAIVIGTATLVVLALGTGASLVDQHLASRAAKEMARFRQLTDATLEGIVVHRDGLIVDVNSALARLVGRMRPALIGHPLTDFVTPEAAQRLGRRVETGSPRRDEIDIVTADGLRRVEIFTREAEHDGGPARISAVRDITERKREEALADAEQRMLTAIAEDRPLSETLEFACRGIETVLPDAACSVLLMSPDRRALRHVAAPSLPAAYCAAIDGTPIGPAAGSCGTAAWSGEEVIVEEIAADPLWRDYRDLALPHGLLACWSIPLKSKGGTVLGTFATYHRERYRPTEAELEAVRRLAASSAIAIQRKRQDEALIAEKEKAQAASRAKSEFLASMSHELRTPLNAILGFSEVIEHQLLGTGASERYAGYAADIHRSGRHLLDLINDLLDVARIESGKMQLDRERCDIPALVAEQVAMVRRAFPDAARIEVEDAPGCPPVMGDARALGQIVLNVVGNAAKFTPADGRIVIRVESEPPGFRLIVTDDGPGIAPELLEELGQPFRHGEAAYSRRYGGTGLGLHISSALAEAHGGRLAIASTLGHGTTVTIALPEEAVVREAPAEAVAIAAD